MNFEIRISNDTILTIYAIGQKTFWAKRRYVLPYRDHNFIIIVDEDEQLNPAIFTLTKQTVTIKFWKQGGFLDKNGKFFIMWTYLDEMSIWEYKYVDGKFNRVSFYKSKLVKEP